MKSQLTLIFLVSTVIVSCSTFAPPSAPTSPPTITLTQTATPSPTETPSPTATLSWTNTPDATALMLPKQMPTGEPAESWKGIPIMPGAVSGGDDGMRYIFTIRATTEEIQAYYERELMKQGASQLHSGRISETDAFLIACSLGDESITILILPYEGLMLVILSKGPFVL